MAKYRAPGLLLPVRAETFTPSKGRFCDMFQFLDRRFVVRIGRSLFVVPIGLVRGSRPYLAVGGYKNASVIFAYSYLVIHIALFGWWEDIVGLRYPPTICFPGIENLDKTYHMGLSYSSYYSLSLLVWCGPLSAFWWVLGIYVVVFGVS